MQIHEFINYSKNIVSPMIIFNKRGEEIGTFEKETILNLFSNNTIDKIGAISKGEIAYIALFLD